MSKKMDKRSYADVSATRTQTSLSRYNFRAVACASSPVTHVLRSPLCEARRETKRPRRRLLMYYLAGSEVPQYAKFCSTIFFFVYRSFCPLPLIDLFRVNWLQLNNKKQKLIRGWTTHYEFLQKHKQNFKTSWKSGLGFSPRFRSFEEG